MPDTTPPDPAARPALVVTAGPNVWHIPAGTPGEAAERLAEFHQHHPQASFWGDFKATFDGVPVAARPGG